MPLMTITVEITPTPATQTRTKKLDRLTALLMRPQGATVAEMIEASGWQAHSVRGTMSGLLKSKLGLIMTSSAAQGVRVYSAAHIEGAA